MRDSGRVGADGQFSAVLRGEGNSLVVPGGEAFLLAADFIRSGPDLILVGPDGQQILILGFFMGEPTDLVTETGAVVDAELASKLAGPAAPAQFAQADGVGTLAAIGKVSNLTGTVQVRRADGSSAELKAGDEIYQGDVLSTAKDGSVGLTFLDGTTFALGSAGRMVLDEMVYDAGAQSGSAAISVMTGSFTLVSGAIPKMMPDAMQLKTPAMTIGIRGTGVAGNGQTVALMEERGGVTGEITVTTPNGQTMTLNQPGMAASVGPGGGLSIMQMTPQQIAQMAGNALGALPNGQNSLSDSYGNAGNQEQQNQQPPPPPPAPPFEQNGNSTSPGDAVQAALMVAVAEAKQAVAAMQQAADTAAVTAATTAEIAKRAELDLLALARAAEEAEAAARTKVHADEAEAQAAIAAEAAQSASASLTDSAAAAGFAATAATAAAAAQAAYDAAIAEASGFGSAAAAQVARAATAAVAASADSGYAQGFAESAANLTAAAISWRDTSAIQARITAENDEAAKEGALGTAKGAYDDALAAKAVAELATYEPMILQAGTAAAKESRQLSFDTAYDSYKASYVAWNGSETGILTEAAIASDSVHADPLVNTWLSGAVTAKLALTAATTADTEALLAVATAVGLYDAAKAAAESAADSYNTIVGELTAAATARGVAEASEISAQAAAQVQAEAGMDSALAAVKAALADAAAASQTATAQAEAAAAATTSADAGAANTAASAASASAAAAATAATNALANAASALTLALNNTLPSNVLFASAPESLQSAALQAYETAQALHREAQAIQQEAAKLAAQAVSSAQLAQQSYDLLAVADIAAIGTAQSAAATAATAASSALDRADAAVASALAAKGEAETLLAQLTDKYPTANALLTSATQAVAQIAAAYDAAVAARDNAFAQNASAAQAKIDADLADSLEVARDAAQAGATAAKSASTQASAAAAQASLASNYLTGARNTAATYEVTAGRAADAEAAQAALASATTAKTNAASAYNTALAAKNAAALALVEAQADRDAAQATVTTLTTSNAGTADPHSLALATRAVQQAEAAVVNAEKLLGISDSAVVAAALKQTALNEAYAILERAVAGTVAANAAAQPTSTQLAAALKAAEAVANAAADVQRLAGTANVAAADSVTQSLSADGFRIAAQDAAIAAQTSLSVKAHSDAAVAAATSAASAATSAATALATAKSAAADAAAQLDLGSYVLETFDGYRASAGSALADANTAVSAATTALANAIAARDAAHALVATLSGGGAGTLALALAERATSVTAQAQASLSAAQRDLAATQAAHDTTVTAYNIAAGTIQLADLIATMQGQADAADTAAQASVILAAENRDSADLALAAAQANYDAIVDLAGSPPAETVVWIDNQQAAALVALNNAAAAAAAAAAALTAAIAAEDAIAALISGDNWTTAGAAKAAADAAAVYAAAAARQADIAQFYAGNATQAAAVSADLKAAYDAYLIQPLASGDAEIVAEDGSVTIDVFANDSTRSGEPLVYAETGDGARITAVGTPANGTVTISGGSIVYTPNPDYYGADSFTYTVTNTVTTAGVTTSQTATATVTIDVTPVNDAPVLSGDAALAAIDEDPEMLGGVPVSTILAGNFSDVDVGSSMAGIAVIANTADAATEGTWRFFTGTDWADIGPATEAGAVALSAGTMLMFVPAANYNGTPPGLVVRALDDTYAGSWSDSAGALVTVDTTVNGGSTAISTSTSTIGIMVNPTNDPPSFSGGVTMDPISQRGATDPAGATIAELFGPVFSDIDGDSLGGIAVTSASVINGAWQYSTDDGGSWHGVGDISNPYAALALSASTMLRFVPNAGYTGVADDLFAAPIDTTYQGAWSVGGTRVMVDPMVYDPYKAIGSPVYLSQTIAFVNDVPVLDPITLSGTEDTVLAIGAAPFLGAFSDVDGDTLVSVEIQTLAIGGDLKLSGNVVTINQVIAAADLPNLTFEPSPDWNGNTSFTWRAFDGYEWSDTASADITVAAVNDAPVVVSIAGASVVFAGGSAFTIPTDVSTKFSGASDFSVVMDINPDAAGGTLWRQHGYFGQLEVITAVGADGSLTFAIGAQSIGWDWKSTPAGMVAIDEWSQIAFVKDGGTARIYVNGTEVFSAAIGATQLAAAATEDATRFGSDGGGGVYYGELGSLKVYNAALSPAEMALLANSGVVAANLAADYRIDEGAGTTLADSSGNANIITLTGQSWGIITGSVFTLIEDTSISGIVEISDVDGDSVAGEVFAQGIHGMVVYDPVTRQWTYTPEPGYIGADSFTLRFSDGQGGVTDQVFSVAIWPANGDAGAVGGEIAPSGSTYLFTAAMLASGETYTIRNSLAEDAILEFVDLDNLTRDIQSVRRVGDDLELAFLNGTKLIIENHFTTGQVEWMFDEYEDGMMRMAQAFAIEMSEVDHLFLGPFSGNSAHVQGGAGDDYLFWQGGGGSYDGGGGWYNGVSFINATTGGVVVDLGLAQYYNGEYWGQATIGGTVLYLMNVNEIDGTRFSDTMTGSADNVDGNGHPNGATWEFRGYGGGDIFDSGGGFAFVAYDWALGGITLVSVTAGVLSASYAASSAYAAGTDTLIDIFGIEGSDFGDILDVSGSDQYHFLDGGAGDDTLHASAYGSHLIGGAGRDLLYGGSGADVFSWRDDDTDQNGITRETTDVIIGFGGFGVDKIDLSYFWDFGLSFGTNVWASAPGLNDTDTLLSIDLTGDAIADFTIWVDGVYYGDWDSSWFIWQEPQYSNISLYYSNADTMLEVSGSAATHLTVDLEFAMVSVSGGTWFEIPYGLLDVNVTGVFAPMGITVIGNSLDNTITGYDLTHVEAGAGDDTVVLFNNDFISLDGGAGIDFLAFHGETLDLTSKTVTGFEIIDLSIAGVQTLILDSAAIDTTYNAATGTSHSLVIVGSNDNILLDGGGWTLGATDATVAADPNGGGSYSIYSHTDGAQVFVENGNSVTLVTPL